MIQMIQLRSLTSRLTLTTLFVSILSAIATGQTSSWQETNGPYGGEIFCLAINSDGDIFAGTLGGMFRSTKNGDNWREINISLTNLAVWAFAINGNDDVFAGTSGGVFRSTDKGDNWVSTGLSTFVIRALAISPKNEIYAACGGAGVFRSTDNGVTWSDINAGLTDLDVFALAIARDGTIVAGTRGGVFHSVDNGNSWNFAGLPGLHVAAIDFTSNGKILAGVFTEGVFCSTDGIGNWRQINTGLPDFASVHAFAIDRNGAIFAGTSGGVFRSTDNGDTWGYSGMDLMDLAVWAFGIDGNDVLFAGTRAGVFRSTDNGDNWRETNIGLTDLAVRAFAINGNDDIFAGTSGGVFRSRDDGDTWSKAALPIDDVWALAIGRDGIIFAGTSGGIFRSIDKGDTWSDISMGLTNLKCRHWPSTATAASLPELGAAAYFGVPAL